MSGLSTVRIHTKKTAPASATNTQPGPRPNRNGTPMNRTKNVARATDKLSTSENVREVAAVMLILTTAYAATYGFLKALIALGWCA